MPRQWNTWLERSQRMQMCSNPSCDGPNSLKQVMALPNAQQYVRVLRVLGDDQYKWMTHATVGGSR